MKPLPDDCGPSEAASWYQIKVMEALIAEMDLLHPDVSLPEEMERFPGLCRAFEIVQEMGVPEPSAAEQAHLDARPRLSREEGGE